MSGAHLRVDLERFRANIDALRQRVAAAGPVLSADVMTPVDLMLVVKNDAYGHGLQQIVSAAAAHGVRRFGAFDVSTGVRARAAAGPTAQIFSWMTVDRDEIAEALAADLELGVGDAGYLEDVAAVSAGRATPVHLKIDTGLHRNGVRREDWPGFVSRAADLQRAGDIRVVGLWSHLAETSDETDDAARAEFVDAVAVAHRAGLAPAVLHLAASAAGYARPEFRFDLVRFGAFGFGIRSAEGPDLAGLAPVAALLAPVSAVSADSVRVAVGALDGLPSTLGGRVQVGTPAGARALLEVGDTELRIAAWPGAAVGQEVALFGPGTLGESSATTLAEAAGTVGEEILVRISPLVPRTYVG